MCRAADGLSRFITDSCDLARVHLCYPAFGKEENTYCKPLKQIKGDVKVNVLYSRENHLKQG